MLNIKYIIFGSILNIIYEQDFSMLYNALITLYTFNIHHFIILYIIIMQKIN